MSVALFGMSLIPSVKKILLLYLLLPLFRVFTILVVYLKKTMFLVRMVLQLPYSYNLWYT